jgi:predicted enzyme related to lactoylglutathione lyase
MPKVVHFEIPADNPERAIAFYRKAFNWEFQKFEGPMSYWMIMTGARDERGIDGGLMPREYPGQGPVTVVDVESVDEASKTIKNAGGEPVAPKASIPGVGYAAYFKDTEGNVFGIFQGDPMAK